MKSPNEMTSQEIEDEILRLQKVLDIQEQSLGEVQTEISTTKKYLIDLNDKIKKAEYNIKMTNQDIRNLEKIYKWRALRKEKGY